MVHSSSLSYAHAHSCGQWLVYYQCTVSPPLSVVRWWLNIVYPASTFEFCRINPMRNACSLFPLRSLYALESIKNQPSSARYLSPSLPDLHVLQATWYTTSFMHFLKKSWRALQHGAANHKLDHIQLQYSKVTNFINAESVQLTTLLMWYADLFVRRRLHRIDYITEC